MADEALAETGGASPEPAPLEYVRVQPDGSMTPVQALTPQSRPVSTQERPVKHTNESIKRANGQAQLNAGATAQSEKDWAYDEYRRLVALAKARQQQAYDRTLAENTQYYKDHPWMYLGKSLLTGDEDMIKKEANAASFDRDQTSFLNPSEAASYNKAQGIIAGNAGGVAHAFGTGLVDGTGIASEEHPEGSREALHAQASTNEYPLARFLGTVGPGIFFGWLSKKGAAVPEKAPIPEPQPKSVNPEPKAANPVPVGEPVSVANGEYLETWHDFFIPGTLAFDGARYMGLKLALPQNYVSPLGPCQISMFDEVFSNPERGQLLFHDADGKAIHFERPFNFLPSINAAYPHLELTAPWLKQLTLKDRGIIKHFRQYDDDVYRLEQIDDLNGNSLLLQRSEQGRLERIEGPDGLSLAFDNDVQGRRLHITLIGTDGSRLDLAHYVYDERGRMTSADCTFGMSVRYVWRTAEDLLTSWHNITRQSETYFTYDDAGRVVHTATNGIWNGDRFEYGDGETRYLPGGSAATAQLFEYDDNENVTAEIDALGGVVAHSYDANGFRIATTDQNGHARRMRYDIHGNIKESTDPEGRTTTYGWGDDGELMTVIDGVGNRTSYEHDDKANVIAEKDAEGHVTRLVRDNLGHVVETQFPNGAVERRNWDGYNRVESVTDAKGNTTRFEYDAFNRLIATIAPNGSVARQSYQAGSGGFDTVSSMTRPDGVNVARSFDGSGQLATVSDGEGRTWTYGYGAFGVLETITDPKGGVLRIATDIEGRFIAVTNAMGRVYSFERDAAGRVVLEEDFDGHIRRYERDAAGQVTKMLKPDGAVLLYAYDKSGLIKRIESFGPKGEAEDVTRFWYDARALLVKTENKAALVELQRDRNGRIVGETLNGKRTRSKRDAMGNRVLRETLGLGGGLVEYVRDPLGLIEKMAVGESEFSFRHDTLGRETTRRMGGFHLQQRFDAAGQLLAQVAGPAGDSGLDLSRLGWNIPQAADAQRSTRTRTGQIRRTYDYDRAFAPVAVDDNLWGERHLTYDDNGQVTNTEAPFGSERFRYDEARNLAGASSSISAVTDAPTPYGRAFDETFGSVMPAGTPQTWNTTAGGVVQIARGPKGERIQLKHDDCGRLVERRVDRDGFRPQRWRYSWDAHDRLVGVVTSEDEEWLFRYDPFGRRVSKVRRFSGEEKERAARLWPALVGSDGVPAQSRAMAHDAEAANDNALPAVGTAYLWDGDQMVAEAPLRLDGYIAWDAAIHWHFEEGTHRLLAKQLASGEMLAVVCDHLGTPKEMFDKRGDLVWAADHHVWGAIRTAHTYGALATAHKYERLADELHCPWRFPGQYEDGETGLYYNHYRHYDALSGQYASPDLIGLAGGDRPQGYVANPTVWVDPLGLKAEAAKTPQKRGPKTDPNAPHNAKIRQLGDEIVANGGTIIAGGGRLPEIAVKTEGGVKSTRRPDIIYRDANGVVRGINVGKVKADGVTPVTREGTALQDLNKYWGPTTFVPYN